MPMLTNPHLVSMGAVEMPRKMFLARAEALIAIDVPSGHWRNAEASLLD